MSQPLSSVSHPIPPFSIKSGSGGLPKMLRQQLVHLKSVEGALEK
jgi:hypothetical protein